MRKEAFNLEHVPRICRTDSGSIRSTSSEMKINLVSQYLFNDDTLAVPTTSSTTSPLMEDRETLTSADFLDAMRRHYSARKRYREAQKEDALAANRDTPTYCIDNLGRGIVNSRSLVNEIRSDLELMDRELGRQVEIRNSEAMKLGQIKKPCSQTSSNHSNNAPINVEESVSQNTNLFKKHTDINK